MTLAHRSRYDFAKLSVLLVDDSDPVRRLTGSVLRAFGVNDLHLSSDAQHAFKTLLHEQVDIVLVDWYMPELDGIDFVRLLRNSPDSPNPYIPIIMVTGLAEAERVIEARDAGVHEFVAKPFTAKSLAARMVSIIENPRRFVRAGTYFGPERRQVKNGPPTGTFDRRTG